MRYVSQQLPKKVYKSVRTAKHKDSDTKKERVALKEAKNKAKDEMMEDVSSITPVLTEAQKIAAKMERKKANRSKNDYKRIRPKR
jgi:hypothetical protein